MPISRQKIANRIRDTMSQMEKLKKNGTIPLLAFKHVTGYTHTAFYKWLGKGIDILENEFEFEKKLDEAEQAYADFAKLMNQWSAELEIDLLKEIRENEDWRRFVTLYDKITGERYNQKTEKQEGPVISGFKLIPVEDKP